MGQHRHFEINLYSHFRKKQLGNRSMVSQWRSLNDSAWNRWMARRKSLEVSAVSHFEWVDSCWAENWNFNSLHFWLGIYFVFSSMQMNILFSKQSQLPFMCHHALKKTWMFFACLMDLSVRWFSFANKLFICPNTK